MYKPLALFIGLRYLRAKRKNGFISFISLASFLGIALGVTVLITVLSVMNGFDQQIRQKIFSLADQVTVSNYQGKITRWEHLSQTIKQQPYVSAVTPFVDGQGMLTKAGEMVPVLVKGVLPRGQRQVANMDHTFVEGGFDSLVPGAYGALLGSQLAARLGVIVGDKITLISPKVTVTPMGMMPRYKRLTVRGIFHVGSGFGYDGSLAFLHLEDAQKIYQKGSAVSGLRVRVDDLYHAIPVTTALQETIGGPYQIGNWTQQYGQLFQAIQMEKTMMFLILFLIIGIAAFNLVSMLVMMVTDKQSEIAILRTQGASRGMIMAIFVVQGCAIGVIGTALGVLSGVLLSMHVTEILTWLENLIEHHFVMESVYWIDYLPSKLMSSDVKLVASLTLLMCLLATLYPAAKAAKTNPAQALRYE